MCLTICSLFFSDNPTARDNPDSGHRFLFDPEDPMNIGRILHELKNSCLPQQKYLYCFPLNQREKDQMTRMGQPHVLYNMNRPVGKNTIAQLVPNLCRAAGIKDWKKKTPHCC